MREDDLTVAEAAEAIGTTPQTVRALLRKGELGGRKREWGTRYVWVPSRRGVAEFLTEHGRLDGRRRRRPPPVAPADPAPAEKDLDLLASLEAPEQPDQRPFVLRPRGRATAVTIVLGVPALLAYAAARVIPGALWFHELGQTEVFVGVGLARLELYLAVAVAVTVFVGANLAVAVKGTELARSPVGTYVLTGISVLTGTLFASAAEGQWQTFMLWRHRQSFGVDDPLFGKDVGYFVFSLPFELMISELLLWLVAIAAAYVVLAYLAGRAIGLRPPHATLEAQVHLASLCTVFLLVVAWRLRLQQYLLELGQPSARDSHSFSGAGYVDVHVRLPGVTALTVVAVALALACVAAPFVVRAGQTREVALAARISAGFVVAAVALVVTALPALVQRYVVDPSPLPREQPYLERSISATRAGLGLDTINVEAYAPPGGFSAADFTDLRERLDKVAIWDSWVLESRMRELVSETPYYRPAKATPDIVRVGGRSQLTLVSARELDLGPVRGGTGSWINSRLAYSHGLGLIRFSGTSVEPSRGPELLDDGLGLREPRIYFGDFPQSLDTEGDADESVIASVTRSQTSQSPWVLANTRRPEVDIPVSDGAQVATYHYDGTGGIELSTWIHRAAFALALHSKELLLSDEVTPESRILLHRDVHERLETLAPFIQWDSAAVPLTVNGRIVFVVDGYTTSRNYPYAERVSLGGAQVNYARASVRATVDAFSGRVDLYLIDDSEPIARAWAETFPTLFRAEADMPAELRPRLRYPMDLFQAQSTAFERFHTTRPDLFVSNADAWSRPLALSGPIEVAGDVDFDESDEDDLRLTLPPGYTFSTPPGQTRPQLLLGTFYTPFRGQNLVATLSGWIDEEGRTRLAARNLPRDPVTLGPAQMSRLVFATPRVRNLLGLRNLELRDVDTSSLDAVLLGRPHLLFLPSGVIQIQSLYEGTRGAGAARLLGVTAFVGGRAGLGPDIGSAVRQALNRPPSIDVERPAGPVVVGTPVELGFRVENARREVVTITTSAASHSERLRLVTGRGAVEWVPPVAGQVQVRVEVLGLDGTRVVGSTAFRVLSAAPSIRVIRPPSRAVVGRPVRVTFQVRHGIDGSAKVSTPAGIVFQRQYLIRNGTGIVEWTPTTAGPAVVLIHVRGRQGQTASKTVRLAVRSRPESTALPTVTLLRLPDTPTAGQASEIAFRAGGCRDGTARIEGPGDSVRAWRFACPAPRATLEWTPQRSGRYLLTIIAHGSDTSAQVSTRLTVGRSR